MAVAYRYRARFLVVRWLQANVLLWSTLALLAGALPALALTALTALVARRPVAAIARLPTGSAQRLAVALARAAPRLLLIWFEEQVAASRHVQANPAALVESLALA